MRPSLAPFLSLLSLVACSRGTVTISDAARDTSLTSDAADAALDAATTDGGAKPRAPTACFGHRLEWRDVGGMSSDHDEHSLSSCRSYRVKLATEDDDRPRRTRKSCAYELPVGGPAPTLDDLELALADPVVAEAFARGGLVGQSKTPGDGSDLVVVLDGKRVAFGRDVPAPIKRLRRVLVDLGGRGVMRCRGDDGGVFQGDAASPRR